MWSSLSSCWECWQWANCSHWRQYFFRRRSNEGNERSRTNKKSTSDDISDYGGVSHDREEIVNVFESEHLPVPQYGDSLYAIESLTRRFSGDVDLKPFRGFERNKVKHQALKKMRKYSSSSSDISSISRCNKSGLTQRNDAAEDCVDDAVAFSDDDSVSDARNGEMEYIKKYNSVSNYQAAPMPTSITVTQQPETVKMYRPDLEELSVHSHRRFRDTGGPQLRSVSDIDHRNRSNMVIPAKKYPMTFMTPSEAARPATWQQSNSSDYNDNLELNNISNARSLNSFNTSQSNSSNSRNAIKSNITENNRSSPRSTVTKSTTRQPPQLISQDDDDDSNDVVDKNDNIKEKGLAEIGALTRIINSFVGTVENAKYEYKSSSSDGTKVQLRSKSTALSIAERKIPQIQKLVQYTFGNVTFAYKCSREKILEVDVLSVTSLPVYCSTDPVNSKLPSLTYVDIEVRLRLANGKELQHKIKKFRTGEIQDNNDAFEPECSFRRKELENSVLVLTVKRRKQEGTPSHAVLGHGLYPVTMADLQTPGIQHKALSLKQGDLEHAVKGSVMVALTCSQPSRAGDVNLTLDVRMVQQLDVSKLGIFHGSPDFKIKPEIKIRIRLLGGNGSKHHDFPWIGIQNNSKFNSEANGHEARNNKSACELRTVGGWGTLFPSGCSLVRTAKDSDIKRLSPHFQIQVYGRNNVGPAIKKEVLLGTVLLGPELRSAELPGIEESPLTHWGEAVTKRSSVEACYRMFL